MHVQKLEFSLWFSRRAPLIEKYAYPRAKLRRGSDRTGRPWSNGRCVIELCSTVDRGENGRVRLKFITRSCHFTLRSSFQNIEFHSWCAISPFYLSPRYFNFFTFALKTKWKAANVNVRMKCCSYWNTNSSLEGERKLEKLDDGYLIVAIFPRPIFSITIATGNERSGKEGKFDKEWNERGRPRRCGNNLRGSLWFIVLARCAPETGSKIIGRVSIPVSPDPSSLRGRSSLVIHRRRSVSLRGHLTKRESLFHDE